MKPETLELERELQQALALVIRLKSRLDGIRRQCQHQWGPVVYTPDVIEGYMGVDNMGWRPVERCFPRQETPKWTKTCALCGDKMTTSQTSTETKVVPKF